MASQHQSILMQACSFAVDVANGRHPLSKLVPPALLAADILLCALVIWKVPYTEIDWVAYMEQVSQFLSGERDYAKIAGGTGPLVYPALHVYIYSGLYRLTDSGHDIRLAQTLFAVLYIATLALVMACYRQARAPPYIFPLLVLSKRLHSIYMLRCFNDGVAALLFWLAVFVLQRRLWATGAVVFSLGVGVKMSLLLSLPAVGIVLFLGCGLWPSLWLAWVMVQIQAVIGIPFLRENATGYLSRAFELSRQFFFQWTVNWRFVGEDVFLSRPFSLALLGLHAGALLLFITTRWLKPARKSLAAIVTSLLYNRPPFTAQEEVAVSRDVTPKYILTTSLTAMAVGMLFARSLHYQFYAYLAWATPFLLWRSGIHPVFQYALWAAQEWAWNVYPSTPLSSGVVVSILAATVALVWWGATEDWEPRESVAKADTAKR